MADVFAETVGGLQAAAGTLISQQTLNVLLSLIGAAIIILIGWIIGKIVKQIVIKLLQSTRVDQWIDEQNLAAAIGGKEISALAGSLVKWYIIVLFLAQATQTIQLEALKEFLMQLVIYVPKVLGGIVVFVGGLLLGRYAKNAIEITQHKMKKVASVLAESIIVLFSGVLALTMIIGENYMAVLARYLELFIGPFIWAFAIVIAIVLGISVGVNFKEDIKKLTADVRKTIK